MDVRPESLHWDEDCTVLASEPYLRVVGDEFGWLRGEAHGAACFFQPYVVKQRMGFRYAVLPVQAVRISDGEEGAFYTAVVQCGRELGWDFIGQSPSTALFTVVPPGAVSAPFGSYIIDLSSSEDDLWSGLHSKHRNVIRHAMKSGVAIKSGKEYSRLSHDLVRGTMARSHMGFVDEKTFMRFIDEAGDNAEVFCAFHEDHVQGCAIIPHSRYAGYYLWGGSVEKPFLGSINFLHWAIIRYLRAKGARRYDLMGARLAPAPGSKIEGIQRFKERFGGDLSTGYLWKYPLRRGKYLLYEGLSRLRGIGTSRFGGDIIDQERKVRRTTPALPDVRL